MHKDCLSVTVNCANMRVPPKSPGRLDSISTAQQMKIEPSARNSGRRDLNANISRFGLTWSQLERKPRTEMPRGPLLAVFAPAGVVTVHRDIMDEFVKFKHLCTLRVVWPKQWWTRTVIKEMENIGKTWSEAEKIAKNRVQWRAIVKALCLRRAKETHNCAPVKVSTTWSEWRVDLSDV